jgi:hypothetical protein
MRPKANVVVVGIRPELRYMLRIVGRVRVWPVETVPQFRRISAVTFGAIIVDCRDAPMLARKVVNHLRRFPTPARTILLAPREEQKREPVCDVTVRDGLRFYDQLLIALRFALARKRGPVKQSTENAEWTKAPKSVLASR